MRDIIINLMEKLIVTKYGPMDYHVVSTNDFGSRRELGYIIHCEFKQNQHRTFSFNVDFKIESGKRTFSF